MNEEKAKELFNRIESFRCKITEKYYNDNEKLFQELASFNDEVLSWKESGDFFSRRDILYMALQGVFDRTIEEVFKSLSNNPDLYDNILNACLYWVLCMFIHTYKPENNISTKEFVYNHSPLGFNDPKNTSKCEYNAPNDSFHAAAERFRKYKSKVFNDRGSIPINKNNNLIMSRDMEYEWQLFFNLESMDYNKEEEKAILTVHSQLLNINNEIRKIINYSYKSNFEEDRAYIIKCFNLFNSKLKKISYHNFLELYKYYLDYLKSEKTYYGINMLRLEKMLCPYTIVLEVTRLRNCYESEKNKILQSYCYLQEINQFPDLYDYLDNYDLSTAVKIKDAFITYFKSYLPCFLVILDSCVEGKLFGENWEEFILNETTVFAKKFYDIDNLLFEDDKVSQQCFYSLLLYPAEQVYKAKLRECEEYHQKNNSVY